VILVGKYTSGSFTLGDDGSGHLKITDPAVDGGSVGSGTTSAAPLMSWNAPPTLGYAANAHWGADAAATTNVAPLAQLGQCIASFFAAVADGHLGAVISAAVQSVEQTLTHPHA
jgi:hypothetical protein